MQRLRDLPFLVVLMGVAALAMLLPALHAAALREHAVGRAFLYSAILLFVLAGLIGLATANRRPRHDAESRLGAMLAAYLLLPVVLAVPFHEVVPGTGFSGAWFEMVSAFTTTGATLQPDPSRLPDPVHLWRAIVGWLGGFFTLLCAAAILAPLNLGGFEVLSPRRMGRAEGVAPGEISASPDRSDRLVVHARRLLPVYAALTLVLWVGLLLAGEPGLPALCHAMAVISTSGISPVGGVTGAEAGFPGEVLMFLGLCLALTRRSLPGAVRVDATRPLRRDPELRIAIFLVASLPLALFVRHWFVADGVAPLEDARLALGALWGAVFTVLSFLTTTGFVSGFWDDGRIWSGLETPGLLLLGLAIMGGGVATTAGGVRLLRVFALMTLGRQELMRLSFPHSVLGSNAADTRLRDEGAHVAFVFFMLFALSLGAVTAALALAGVDFERAVILSVAALTTTGPLTEAAGAGGIVGEGQPVQAVLGVAMILGRFETLALVALLLPGARRR
jgi:trk system potassium uptake protein TrkH